MGVFILKRKIFFLCVLIFVYVSSIFNINTLKQFKNIKIINLKYFFYFIKNMVQKKKNKHGLITMLFGGVVPRAMMIIYTASLLQDLGVFFFLNIIQKKVSKNSSIDGQILEKYRSSATQIFLKHTVFLKKIFSCNDKISYLNFLNKITPLMIYRLKNNFIYFLFLIFIYFLINSP